MDPYNPQPMMQAPQLPKPKKPPKPDPAARRMKPLDYVALLLGVEPPPPDANLPPPVGYRFPDAPPPEPFLPAPVPMPMLPPTTSPQPGVPPPAYMTHALRMRGKMGWG